MNNVLDNLTQGLLLIMLGMLFFLICAALSVFLGVRKIASEDSVDLWVSMSISSVILWAVGRVALGLFSASALILPFTDSEPHPMTLIAGLLIVIIAGFHAALRYSRAELVERTGTCLRGKARKRHLKYVSGITRRNMRFRGISALLRVK